VRVTFSHAQNNAVEMSKLVRSAFGRWQHQLVVVTRKNTWMIYNSQTRVYLAAIKTIPAAKRTVQNASWTHYNLCTQKNDGAGYKSR